MAYYMAVLPVKSTLIQLCYLLLNYPMPLASGYETKNFGKKISVLKCAKFIFIVRRLMNG